MNQMYGFEGEVKAKYTAQMFQLFSEVFQWLPLAQCINSKVLVSAHILNRRLSPALKLIHQLQSLFHTKIKLPLAVFYKRERLVKYNRISK